MYFLFSIPVELNRHLPATSQQVSSENRKNHAIKARRLTAKAI